MKHLHLATGLLICAYLAGCGDYGDDGAVNSTGTNNADLGSTDFNLALAVPTFDGVSGKPRIAGKPGAVAHAVTGSTAYNDLLPADVRAYVIVPDNASAAGFREVSIDVAEFESLGNGRYRIAIDGQPQVDGFFAITIDGVVFRIPLSRTGTTNAPIDVNALQAALADRLQALLVANEVCDAVSTDQLNAVLDNGEAYMAGLDVPSSVNDVESLIEFYRVAVSGFIQAEITQLCAPVLNTLAVDGIPGTYHALSSGVYAKADSTSTIINGFATLSSVEVTLGTVTGEAVLADSVEYDSRYSISHAQGTDGLKGVITDLSVQFPDISAQLSTVTLQAFANDADRVALQHAVEVSVVADTGGRTFVPGFLVKATPAFQQYPQGDSFVGASNTTLGYIDLSAADAGCISSLGLTTAAFADAPAFASAAAAAVATLGDDEFVSRLQTDCGGVNTVGLDVSLQLATKVIDAGTPLAVSDLVGKYAFVGLESTQIVSPFAATFSGYRGSVTDRVFDIDAEGVMTPVSRNRASAFQPVARPLGGVDALDMLSIDANAVSLSLDLLGAPLTDGHIRIDSIDADGAARQVSGFVSPAPHNLMALNMSAYSNNGGKVGGYAIASSLPSVLGERLRVAGNIVIAHSSLTPTIYAVDASIPGDLKLLSSLPGLTSIFDLVVDPNAQYAFVTSGVDGLQVVDISNPLSMSVVGSGLASPSINFADRVGLVVNALGDPVLALLADSGTSTLLHAVDVSNPLAPAVLGTYDLGATSVTSIAVAGNTVLIGGYSSFTLLDISQFLDGDTLSNSFTLIPNSLGIASAVYDIEVVGNTAWLCVDRSLLAIDLTNISSVSEVGSVIFSDFATGVSVEGNHAYVSLDNDGPLGTAVVDIANQTSPALIATLPPSGGSGFANGHLLVATSSSLFGLVALDVSEPVGPQPVGALTDLQSSPYFAVDGNRAYVIGGSDGLIATDISDPANPLQLDMLDTTALGGFPVAIAVFGSSAYITTSTNTLIVVDITDPANLAVVGAPFSLAGLGGNITVFTQGTGTYLAIGSDVNVLLVDVTTPTAPALVQTVVVGDAVYDVAVTSDGNFAFVAGYSSVYVVDMSVLVNAIVVGSVSGVTNVQSVELSGNTLFAATFYNGVQVIDVTTPLSPAVISSYYDFQFLYAMRLVGSTAYLRGQYGVAIIDVSDTSLIRPLGFIASGLVSDIAVSGNTVLTSAYDGTLTIPYQVRLFEVSETQTASTGMAVGVRLSGTPLANAQGLVGLQFTLAGQQLTQTNASTTSREAAFASLAAGSLRFVTAGGEVYPVFDLPFAGMVVADFSGVLPKLELRFALWQPDPVEVDAVGRWSFSLTSGSGDVANFAGYLGADGMLLGRASLFVPQAGVPGVPQEVEGGVGVLYPGLIEASQAMIVGVPRGLGVL